MAISQPSGRRAPSQNPVDFYKGKQQGGARGAPSSVPQKLNGGGLREKVEGTNK
jgi:hypothetical protein